VLNRKSKFLIRGCDIFFAFIGLTALSPVFVVLWVMGYLSLKSPIFKQERLGENKKPFVLFKFRTMLINTASVATHLVSSASVTPYGHFLRKTKLDELPQLWNVLKGDMSLVGPRPGLYNQTDLTLSREKNHVYDVKPGVTGLAQVNAIDMSIPEFLAETDKKMIEEYSVRNYFKYILITVFGKGYGDRIFKEGTGERKPLGDEDALKIDKQVSFFQKVYIKLPVIAFDILAIPLAWFLANAVQFDSRQLFQTWVLSKAWAPLLVLLALQVPCYYGFKVYRGLWQFSSLKDASRIVKAVFTGTLLALSVFYILPGKQIISTSALSLYCLLLMAFLSGARLLLRSHRDKQDKRLDASEAIKRVLIVGAGSAGAGLVRDLQRSHEYLPVGLVDDGRKKRGLEVHGVRVLGTTPQLSELVLQCDADLVFIALPSASSADMRRIVGYCELSRAAFRTLPSLSALASGRVEVNALRTVNIEDLLGRDQVELQWNKIEAGIQDGCVLVTGAGGSIGSELCRQIAILQPKKLILLDNSEANLYHIERELILHFPKVYYETALVSVLDAIAMNELFARVKPSIVFHAAAYKHVPLLEHQARIAVRNNVLGTRVVAEASLAIDVDKFVLISTDKAVNPTNIMGMTKRIAEIYCQNLNQRVNTKFITVRFGNVLGSVGSVVPLFQKQLKAGGPLTVTHPDIQRYFMTIPEASQLILQAMVNGEGGEIFVLDMGEPIKIKYLAEQMIRLAGKKPGEDIEIEYTGLRPGEKLFEELFHPSEELVQTEHEKLFKARFRTIDWDELTQTIRMIQNACNAHQTDELLILLKSLVPEFCSELNPITIA